jgi:hypothetical protein
LTFFSFNLHHATAESEKKSEMSTASVETYWEVPALIIPVVKGDQVYAYVRILVQVMTKDTTSIHAYKIYYPLIQDRFFRDIYGALCDQWLPGKEPNQDTIEKRLQRVLDNLVGPDKLAVYIVNFYFYKPEKKN